MDAGDEGQSKSEGQPLGEAARTAWYWVCVVLFGLVAAAMLAVLLKRLL